jgi:hypothetical protein
MRRAGDGVQFDGLDGAAWRSETENAASVPHRSGSTGGAIVATRTAGMPAGGWVADERPARQTRSTGGRARRSGSITVITSARTVPGGQCGA